MAANVLEELLLLCQAAAEAGEDWRRRLEREWLPQVLHKREEALRCAVAEWKGHGAFERESLHSLTLAILEEAMAEAGYQ